MSVAPAMESVLDSMANISAPYAAMLTMARAHARATDLTQVLYITVSPYVPAAWSRFLAESFLTPEFPNLVHDITYGSPIGNPPPLLHTFIPKNLASANLHPKIINNELLEETTSGHMSGPFTVDEAHLIFDGHFCTSPVGLVEKLPGDGNWQMIRHLSKVDHLGFSTNDALDSDDFPTLFFSAAQVAEWVSTLAFFECLDPLISFGVDSLVSILWC